MDVGISDLIHGSCYDTLDGLISYLIRDTRMKDWETRLDL